MTKTELIDALALNVRLGSKAAAADVVDQLLEILTDELAQGNEVYLGQTFGGFSIKKQAARSGVAMGVEYSTPERNSVKFKPSAKLKAKVNA